MVITLEGITNKGKHRVKQYGNQWKIIKEQDYVHFTPEKGPWLYIVAGGHDNSSRWINKTNDINFIIK